MTETKYQNLRLGPTVKLHLSCQSPNLQSFPIYCMNGLHIATHARILGRGFPPALNQRAIRPFGKPSHWFPVHKAGFFIKSYQKDPMIKYGHAEKGRSVLPHIKEKFSLSESDRLPLPSRHLQGLDQDSEYYSKRFLGGLLFLNLPILSPFPILPQFASTREEEP